MTGDAGALRRCAAFLAVAAALVLSGPSMAGERFPGPVAAMLAKHAIPADAVSLFVQDLSEDAPRWSVNGDVPRNPASVIKLLTTLAALETLGPAYTWRTEALVQGSLSGGRLDGDLIVKGYGDPYLTPQELWRLLRGLRDRGLQTVSGDLVLDSSHFATPGGERDDFDGRGDRAYNALPSALAVNFQVTRVHMYPDPFEGGVRVFTDPPLSNLEVENGLRLVEAPCRNRNHRPRLVVAEGGSGAVVKVSGTFSAGCGESSYARLVLDPEEHLSGAFQSLWSELGGRIEGEIRPGLQPEDARLLHTMESRPLAEVVRGVNKWSNNLMSRSLFLTLGAERFGEPATPEKGAEAVREWLDGRGLSFPELVIENGSGLSRSTRISARSIGELLVHGYRSPVMPELMGSMAVAGVDGTMRKRLKGEPVAGRAHIKTGSLNHVSTMAGYVLDREGRRWAAALLINHKGTLAWQGKQVQDALIRWLYQGADAEGPATRMAGQPPLECGQARAPQPDAPKG